MQADYVSDPCRVVCVTPFCDYNSRWINGDFIASDTDYVFVAPQRVDGPRSSHHTVRSVLAPKEIRHVVANQKPFLNHPIVVGILVLQVCVIILIGAARFRSGGFMNRMQYKVRLLASGAGCMGMLVFLLGMIVVDWMIWNVSLKRVAGDWGDFLSSRTELWIDNGTSETITVEQMRNPQYKVYVPPNSLLELLVPRGTVSLLVSSPSAQERYDLKIDESRFHIFNYMGLNEYRMECIVYQ